MKRPVLPIDSIHEKIIEAFRKKTNLILKASPGSGKTTRVPQFLLEETEGKIFILEPRRLAAKLAARQVARELGEDIGATVGYQFRHEKMVSEKTRIFFLTEGTFLRILATNKTLEGVSCIIVDEFHERHLSTDASLSFLSRLQRVERPDLKVIVMSATLETESLEAFLQQSGLTKTIELELSRFNQHVHYLPHVTSIMADPIGKKVRNVLSSLMEKKIAGDVLVFLPGMKEIRETEQAIDRFCEENNTIALILHGDLSPEEQDRVLLPHPLRKIILSTNIAESSVTIPGIRIVIDSGLHRESSYNFYSGLPELKTTKISRASAIQRAGRSNREGEGHVFRLYAELDFSQRPYIDRPEIVRSDLSELYLLALYLFQCNLEDLPWFEPPPEAALINACDLLLEINAIDELGITSIGKEMLHYPLHPRLSRILYEASLGNQLQINETMTFLFHFLEEKNKDKFFRQFKIIPRQMKNKSLEEILLTGYSDRIAKSRGEKFSDLLLRNGETLKISQDSRDEFHADHPYWIVLLTNHKNEVTKAVSIEEEWLYDLTPLPFSESTEYQWDEKKECVVKNDKITIGKIPISESKSVPFSTHDEIEKILTAQAIGFIRELESGQEFQRILTLNKLLGHETLTISLEEILKPFWAGRNHFNEDDREELKSSFFFLLKESIDPQNMYNLETDLPFTLSLSDKRKLSIHYDGTLEPWIESFIQDFYGLEKTPLLAKGKIPLTLKLLGPHKRAIQVTKDLMSFWKNTYPQMLKEFMREYPRHHWAQDPTKAPPVLLKRQLPS